AATQTMQADAMDDAVGIGRGLDANAQLLEYGGGGAGVFAFQETADLGAALGKRTQYHRAVRDRLVTRHADASTQWSARRSEPVATAAAHASTSSSTASRRRFSSAVPTVIRSQSGRP